MSLHKYQSKRLFKKTPEPKGTIKRSRSKSLEFVVQKHQASSLHYDLRLELDGTLKSWAVPKGPSMNPHDRHLAIAVEDHPFEYRKFEGVIPQGNYGAGKVIIWDKGTYEPRAESSDYQKTLQAELKAGHITFVLHGNKLKGEFALIRNPKMGKNMWLLIKKGDSYATTKDIQKNDTSVVSNETVESVGGADKPDFKSAPRSAMFQNVAPMLAKLIKQPFDDDDWVFEIKWDGYRAIASWDGKTAELYSRNGLDFSKKFASIYEKLHELKHKMVLDGEVVAIDDEGHAHFEWLQDVGNSNQGKLVYYVFDLLWYDGRDLTGWSLTARKQMLKQALPKNSVIRYSDEVVGKGKEFFKQAQKAHLEGVMAKKSSSTYHLNKRTGDWLKIKTHLQQEVVIGGFTEPRGSRENIGSLLLGVYNGKELEYIGNVGTGFNTKLLAGLRTKFKRYERAKSPFGKLVKSTEQIHWLKPTLVAEISFAEWTSDGKVRQAVFLGLRPDKSAQQVVREIPLGTKQDARAAATNLKTKVEFTHLDKVFWPEKGYTKGDLAEYYQSVAKFILPYLKDRPESLLRQPNGYDGQSFFQKDMGTILPGWVDHTSIYSESHGGKINYLICNDVDTLLYMVQLGVIEINPWNSRRKNLTKPDWVAIDLDPEGVDFKAVVETALVVKTVCDELHIPAYPKTSGKTGIHIFIPLGAKYTYKQAKQFAQILVNLVHERLPKVTSLERLPKKRPHKVYLDYLQNNEGQTLASAYSVRPTLAASVSTPLHWSEVNKRLDPTKFTIKTAPKRFEKEGDLWKPVLGKGVDIIKVLNNVKLNKEY